MSTPTWWWPAGAGWASRRTSGWCASWPTNWAATSAARGRRRGRLDDRRRQVGQTGKTIRPKLYIAAGISGAIQHRVGVEGADVIIAINSDPNAPIMDFATYAVIGDALQILPALTEALRERLASRVTA